MQDQQRPQPPQKKNGRTLGILIVIIIILIALGIYSHFKNKATAPTTAPTPTQEQPAPNKTSLPTPKTISAFTLTDDSGKPFTNDNLRGHWTLMFFGFTHCGDVCPTTLTELNKMVQALNKQSFTQLPQVVFVSVDPDRDSTDVIHNYVKNFNPSFIGARGDAQTLDTFAKEMGVYFSKVPGPDANTYSVNHSSQLHVFDPNGNWVAILTYPFQADQLVKTYEAMVNAPASATH